MLSFAYPLDLLKAAQPAKAEYKVGEALDVAGLVVTATVADGNGGSATRELAADEYELLGFDSSKASDKVTVTVQSVADSTKTATFTVKVVADETPTPDPDLATEEELKQLEDAIAKAEAENARRRAEDEVSKARKFGIESFAESLLPVCDSLDAALAIQNATAEQLREGSHATLRQLISALERNKVITIAPAAGEKFNPHQHQAISVVPAEQEPNTVVSVLQKGYLIADRVLRPALVTVTAPK